MWIVGATQRMPAKVGFNSTQLKWLLVDKITLRLLYRMSFQLSLDYCCEIFFKMLVDKGLLHVCKPPLGGSDWHYSLVDGSWQGKCLFPTKKLDLHTKTCHLLWHVHHHKLNRIAHPHSQHSSKLLFLFRNPKAQVPNSELRRVHPRTRRAQS